MNRNQTVTLTGVNVFVIVSGVLLIPAGGIFAKVAIVSGTVGLVGCIGRLKELKNE